MKNEKPLEASRSAKTKSKVDSLFKNVIRGKRLLKLRSGEKLFSQGEPASAVFFVQTGKVQLTVVSPQGKEAVLAMLGPRDFMGEESLVASSRRTSTATSMKPSSVFRIEKRAMLRALNFDPRISREFTTSLLARNVNLEEDLSDQLFNHSERRLACALLKLTLGERQDKKPDATVPKVTQKALAGIVGTTVKKVGVFMKKFRTRGLIDYKGVGDITVTPELLTEAILRD